MSRQTSSSALRLTRLESRDTPAAVGALDPTFNGTGQVTFDPNGFVDVATAPGGKIVAIGQLGSLVQVTRYNPNGTLDTTFSNDGLLTVQVDGFATTAAAVDVRADGSIVVAGTANDDFALARISADGSTVNTVRTDINGLGVSDQLFGVGINPVSGDVFAVGSTFLASGMEAVVVRYDGNLSLIADESFRFTATQEAMAEGVDFDTSGRVYIVGQDVDSSFRSVVGLVRADADLNNSIGNTVLSAKSYLTTFTRLATDPVSGQVFVTRSYGTASKTDVVRLDADLVLQSTIPLSLSGANLDVDSRGRVVVAGQEASGKIGVYRLLGSDLSQDATFNVTGLQSIAFASSASLGGVVVNSQDAITVAGQSATSTGVVARLVGAVDVPSKLLAGGLQNAIGSVYNVAPGKTEYTVPGVIVSFLPGFTQNVRVATADVNGDGIEDFIAGVGPGGPPLVVILDGKTNVRLASFFAFENTFKGGVYVTAADMDGDGFAEVVVTPDEGGGPVAAVYSGAKLAAGIDASRAQIVRFLGIDDPNFRGGARVAIGDINNDGIMDMVVTAGFTGSPRISVLNGKEILAGSQRPASLVPDFFAFESTARNGSFVSVGDVNGDGFADLIFGGGPTLGPRVKIVSGQTLLANPVGTLDDMGSVAGLRIADFFVGDTNTRGGVRVTAKDVDGDNLADLVVGSGDRLPARIGVYRGVNLLPRPTNPTADQQLTPFDGLTLTNGAFVG